MNSDLTLICGDLNARLGNNLDYIPGIDEVTDRECLDKTKNNHGDTLLEFAKDT